MAKEFASELAYLARRNYSNTNAKGMRISIGYGITDRPYVEYHIPVKFLRIFTKYKKVGDAIGAEDRDPWIIMEIGFNQLKPDAVALLNLAIKRAKNGIDEIRTNQKAHNKIIEAQNEKLVQEYLKRG